MKRVFFLLIFFLMVFSAYSDMQDSFLFNNFQSVTVHYDDSYSLMWFLFFTGREPQLYIDNIPFDEHRMYHNKEDIISDELTIDFWYGPYSPVFSKNLFEFDIMPAQYNSEDYINRFWSSRFVVQSDLAIEDIDELINLKIVKQIWKPFTGLSTYGAFFGLSISTYLLLKSTFSNSSNINSESAAILGTGTTICILTSIIGHLAINGLNDEIEKRYQAIARKFQ